MNFSEAFDHLKKDEVMSFLIKKLGNQITLTDRYDKDFAKAISLLIIEQQVSFKAAITIKGRFLKLTLFTQEAALLPGHVILHLS